jgi:hypothetical protein
LIARERERVLQEKRSSYTVWFVNLKARDHLEDLGKDERLI